MIIFRAATLSIKVQTKKLVWGILRGYLNVLNDTKLVLNEHE